MAEQNEPQLSLEEMLALARKVENWEYQKSMGVEMYSGQVDEFGVYLKISEPYKIRQAQPKNFDLTIVSNREPSVILGYQRNLPAIIEMSDTLAIKMQKNSLESSLKRAREILQGDK